MMIIIALENALQTLRIDLDEKKQEEKSSIPTKIMYADESIFLTEDITVVLKSY